MIPEQQTVEFSYMVPENYRKRNVWLLEMGAKESTPKTPTRTDCGSGTRTITSSQSVPMKSVRSANPKPVPVWPDNSVRWLREYDVYICHSRQEPDCSYAVEILSYLEQQPEKLRCFLPMRDMLGGGAITSEMCSGLESSHCWVMLLTPHFLSDDWCKYQMHQFLAQAPCSNGRLIPVMIGLSFAQYPSEVRHMYAFKGSFNDNSVFIKIKGAILTYLKEMITVTSDKIPAHTPPSSRTPERSQSTSKPVGNSQEESSVTKESTSDSSSRISMTQEVTSDVSMGSSVTQITSDISMRSAVTQEVTTSGMSSRTEMTQEVTGDVSMESSVTQEITSDMSMKSAVTQEVTTNDMSMRSLVTQETTRDMSMGSSLIQEFTTDVSSRTSMSEETTGDVPSSCPVTQKTASDMSLRNSLTLKITSDISMTSSLTQETTRDMFIESSLIQEFTTDVSSRNPMTQEANSNKSLRIPLTQETTSEIRLKSLVSEEPSSDTSMRSSFTRQETTHDVSVSSSETSCLSLSPPIMKNRDVCTDYNCTMTVTKDSFSREKPVDKGDSGIWSMTKDLHSKSEQAYSDCSDCYTSRMDDLTGQDSYPQAVSRDISTVISNQNSLTCPREHQCFPNR